MFRDPILSKPISAWKEYEKFMIRQLARHAPAADENIPGLECSTDREGHISYALSDYGRIHYLVKELYMDVTLRGTGPNPVSVFDLRGRAAVADPFIINDILYDYEDAPEDVPELVGKYAPTVQRIYEQAAVTPSRTAIALSVVRSDALQRHAVALVFWISPEGERHIAVYDPMYFKRARKSYTWAVEAVTQLFTYIGVSHIHNLSDYCYRRSGEDIHCAQYVIDAEFCMIYVLYFFYEFAKRRFPHTEEGLRETVTATFIVPPAELVRSICQPNSIFRLRFMSFLLTVIMLMRSDEAAVKAVYATLRTVRDKTGYLLLHPDISTLTLEGMSPNIQARIRERGMRIFYSENHPPSATRSSSNRLRGGSRMRTRRRRHA